jgi:hypothetical protein
MHDSWAQVFSAWATGVDVSVVTAGAGDWVMHYWFVLIPVFAGGVVLLVIRLMPLGKK